jgi:hypothetical protein
MTITFLISFGYILCSIFAVFGIVAIIVCCFALLGANINSERKCALAAIIISIIITAICFAGKESLKELKADRIGHTCKCPIHNCGEKPCLK